MPGWRKVFLAAGETRGQPAVNRHCPPLTTAALLGFYWTRSGEVSAGRYLSPRPAVSRHIAIVLDSWGLAPPYSLVWRRTSPVAVGGSLTSPDR